MEFEFSKNDFFDNKVLTKTYYLQDNNEDVLGELVFDHADGDQINWKENKDVTVKVETRKQRHKSSNKTRVVKRNVPQESFFNFFKPPVISEDEEEEEEDDLEERVQADYEIGEHLKETIIPHAIKWFTGEAAAQYQDEEGEVTLCFEALFSFFALV